ncbi:hypothetical protein N7462_007747 [Penicillium macrosclerotiorum]|uniref:uncharacterized protein n=1 Tax=Penicillium macrosclerotiorum TaxID=303699 RepID=UPI00254751E8|nr:uncharacterized protein N7462_007747 [Penicillium macrosclerotiorum]KAJ5679503.1 hypothetical protein N7462_007747 [Penicillium macrosclerotiorum]
MQPEGNPPRSEVRFSPTLEATVLTLFLQLLSESEKRHFSKYFEYTLSQYVLNNSLKERTYFDSGDFALSAADRVTDNGAFQTGKAHPQRDSISHPYAPIPAASNVDQDAIEDLYKKTASPEKSPLLQHSNIEDAKPPISEGQDNSVSQND